MATKKQKELEAQQRDQSRREITGLCRFAAGLLFAIGVYTDALGITGTVLCRVFFSLFGLLGYVAPLLLLASGILTIVLSTHPRKKSYRYLYFIGGLCLLVILHAYCRPDIKDVKALIYYKEAMSIGFEQHIGGGLLGALLAYPSILLLGEAGTYVLFFAVIIVLLLIITRISLRDTGEKMGKAIKTGVDTAKDRVGQRQRERAAQPPKRKKEPDPEVISDDELFSDAFMDSIMGQTPKSGAKRRRTVQRESVPAAKREPAKSVFTLDPDILIAEPKAEPSIEDLQKVRYSDELNIIPAGGLLERRPVSKVEEDIDDVVAAIVPEPRELVPPDESERRSRISENAPYSLREIEPVEEPPLADAAPIESAAIAKSAPAEPAQLVEAPIVKDMQSGSAVLPYQYPPISLLKQPARPRGGNTESPEALGKLLIDTLASFNISARILNISVGPVITRYELQPAQGVRVSRITTLSNDIALALAASRVRIEAPIPGKAAIGIEIPNKNVSGVFIREIIESTEFENATSPITFALGKDIAGKIVTADLAKMPHLLIAGSTGSGKSVCINNIIASFAYKSTPEEVRMILVDPKVVELKVFSALPHLYLPVVTDPKKAAGALKWATREMDERYQRMSQCNARDIARFNALQTDPAQKMPLLVIIIDELADLMMVAAKDVEDSICRIAQLGRACGIHLIVATQRPSSDIITGLIKANIASRIAFMVSSGVDSRVILDCNGAEKLLGRGDMLFHPNGAGKPLRVQGAFVSDEEVEKIMDFFSGNSTQPVFKETNFTSPAEDGAFGNGKQEDELLGEAVKIVLESGQASISMIQRRLRVGYARAARLVDIMERLNIVSGFEGAKARKLLIGSFAEYEALCGTSEEDAT